ncbi:hypothetical protein DND67_17575 [Pseudomonas syringae pv. pisi]|nr:hypothetical protein DND67_17575 [Pseudomonas syringae pv. pisi]
MSGLLGRRISVDEGRVMIQSGCTYADVASSELPRQHHSTIAELVGHIGDPSVRLRGTL